MRKVLSIAYIIVVSLMMGACGKITTQISADYPVYDEAQALVDTADLIFSGNVLSTSSELIDVRPEEERKSSDEKQELPYTIYEIQVGEVYKGNVAGDTIHIKVLGGEVGDTEYVPADTANILVGETYLFLTKTYTDTYPSLLNTHQGSFHMNAPEVVDETEEGVITLSDILEVLEK